MGLARDSAESLNGHTIRNRVALLSGTLDMGHRAGFSSFVCLRLPLPVRLATWPQP